MKKVFNLVVLLSVLGVLPLPAQPAVPPPMPAYQPMAAPQLDQLLGPIALYPDPLIAQILPAATLPTQIVLADRYVAGGGDPNLIDQQPWDASVQALARYPGILKYLDDNLAWTTELGEAFLNQQQDVMDSVQRLRAEAQNAGNLQSTAQQQVVNDGGDIEILPADPDIIYVPVYQPDDVYYQSGFDLGFDAGWPIGIWLNCDFDWHHRNLVFWNHDHPRPGDWWHERPDQRAASINQHTTVWRPDDHRYSGAVNRGDRGWNNSGIRPISPAINRNGSRPVISSQIPEHNNNIRPEPVQGGHPAPVQHYAPIEHPAANGAFIGIQSSQDTRSFSARGQQSMQPAPHFSPAPQPHYSAPAMSGGGGGSGRRH